MSHERIDVLEPHFTQREQLIGLVEPRIDRARLMKLVEQAESELLAPVALLSFVGRRMQRFPVFRGLGPGLEDVGGTDRSLSFCQFAVRDAETVEVADAANDPRVPQGMVRGFGIASYLGAPVRVEGVPLGTLCVADVVPRKFTDSDKERIEALAEEVSALLQDAREQERAEHQSVAVRDASEALFGELRNVLAPLQCGIGQGALATSELQAGLRSTTISDADLRARVQATVKETLEFAAADLGEIFNELSQSSSRLTCGIEALEALLTTSRARSELQVALKHALAVSAHLTKLVGGVVLDGAEKFAPCSVPTRVVPVIASVLGACARELQCVGARDGVRVAVERLGDRLVLRVSAPRWTASSRLRALGLASELAKLAGAVQVFQVGDCVAITVLALHHEPAAAAASASL